MADFLGLMKQATELKSKMEAMQAELDRIEVEGAAGGGLVTVKLSGKGELRSAHVDESLLKPDQREIIGEKWRPREGPRAFISRGRERIAQGG